MCRQATGRFFATAGSLSGCQWFDSVPAVSAERIELQVGEAATFQIVTAVDPPVGSLAGRFAGAGAVGNAQDPPVPAGRRIYRHQKPFDDRLKTGNGGMKALDPGVFCEVGDPSFTLFSGIPSAISMES